MPLVRCGGVTLILWCGRGYVDSGEYIIHANDMVTELPFDASGEVWWGDSHTMVWEGIRG